MGDVGHSQLIIILVLLLYNSNFMFYDKKANLFIAWATVGLYFSLFFNLKIRSLKPLLKRWTSNRGAYIR